MSARQHQNRLSRDLLATAVLLLALLAVVEFIARSQQQNLQTAARIEASELAAYLGTKLHSELASITHLSSGLSAYFSVRAEDLDAAEIQRMLAALYSDARHIRNFGVAIGYTLTYVHPIEGNQSVLGLDYRQLPGQIDSVQAAIDAAQPTLSRRLQLVQGGHGVVYRAPIFIDGEYWGLLSTVVDIDGLLESAVGDLAQRVNPFAVRDGRDNATLWGDPGLFEQPGLQSLTTDTGWEIGVLPQPRRGLFSSPAWIRIAGLLIALSLTHNYLVSRRHQGELLRVAREDPLTALANRRHINEEIERRLHRLGADGRSGFALIFIDLDGFKQINDGHGHRCGDAVLISLAQRLRHSTRRQDIAARWGGDEFVVLVDTTDRVLLQGLVERLRAIFAMPVVHEGQEIQVQGSIGYAVAPDDGDSGETLICHADHAMYRDKSGRNPIFRRQGGAGRASGPHAA